MALKNSEEKLKDDIYLLSVLIDGMIAPAELKDIDYIYNSGEQKK